jgi:cell division protein FtsL
MAQAARRVDREAPRRGGAHLTVVPPVSAKPAPARKPARARKPAPVRKSAPVRKPARARAREARCRAIFSTIATLAIALTIVGLVRVAIVARAAEMTLSETELAASTKTQRIETDRLEIDRSSLATPSRIEEIASQTMGMGRPASVRYITMPGESTPVGPTEAQEAPEQGAGAVGGSETGSVVASVLGALADMSAIEAQALLVGDVGVTGTR